MSDKGIEPDDEEIAGVRYRLRLDEPYLCPGCGWSGTRGELEANPAAESGLACRRCGTSVPLLTDPQPQIVTTIDANDPEAVRFTKDEQIGLSRSRGITPDADPRPEIVTAKELIDAGRRLAEGPNPPIRTHKIRKWADVKAGMNPESRARAEARAAETLASTEGIGTTWPFQVGAIVGAIAGEIPGPLILNAGARRYRTDPTFHAAVHLLEGAIRDAVEKTVDWSSEANDDAERALHRAVREALIHVLPAVEAIQQAVRPDDLLVIGAGVEAKYAINHGDKVKVADILRQSDGTKRLVVLLCTD